MSFELDDWSLGDEFDPNLSDLHLENTNTKEEWLVYCWGKNTDGELSQKHTKNVHSPEPLKQLNKKRVRSVSSGGNHSGVIDANGRLYLCGSTLHGKIGIEKFVKHLTSFCLFPMSTEHPIKQVACGDYHTLALLEDGRVFGWGGTLHKVCGIQ